MQLAMLGVLGFGMVALFQIINLPVEYDASARAKKQLAELGFLSPDQKPIVRSMLGAAALTYVAGTLSAISQFLYFLLAVKMGLGANEQRAVFARQCRWYHIQTLVRG